MHRCYPCKLLYFKGLTDLFYCVQVLPFGLDVTAWILFLAFFVIGPFGLILVWKSARMGAVAKKILTALIFVYTAVTAYFFYQIIILVLAEMTELNEVMRGIS